MKREMSVEMRLSEMEDYKGHIKQDLVSILFFNKMKFEMHNAM